MHRFAQALLAALVLLTAAAAPAGAALPKNSVWKEQKISSLDGTKLNVDVFRYKDAPADARQPVIMVVSPYTVPEGNLPSSRFNDFVDGADILRRGYTYVIVTMRSFGKSEGCSDWGGPGEQMDVVAGVEWAARQPWSNGQVGLYGKSYDGWTGLMGIANRANGLEAVIAQEPVFDGYRYLYNNGVRFTNSALTPTSFMTTAVPACAVSYIAEQQDDNGESAFWQARELIKKSRGATTPLFLTQGFLERNTKQDGAFDYFNGVAGPRYAWYGQFDHVRGNDRAGTEFAMGRSDFIKRALTFYDAFLKDDPQAMAEFEALPEVEVQDSEGRYRAEEMWPPRDAMPRQTTLRPGAYSDNGLNNGSPDAGTGANLLGVGANGQGHWSISQALGKPVRLAGEPLIDADVVTAAPRANFTANVYDIAPDGTALLVSRGTRLVRTPGAQTISLKLYGQDWVFPKDHRIGVLLSGSNSEWWVHAPTFSPVVVAKSFVTLPLLAGERTSFGASTGTARLRQFRTKTISVPAPVVTLSETPFNVGG